MTQSFFSLLLCLIMASACVKQTAPATDDSLPAHVTTIVVLPVTLTADTRNKSTQNIKELDSGGNVLAQVVEEYFSDNTKVRMVSSEEIESLQTNYSSSRHDEQLRLGASLHAEAVMLWDLKQYNERKGPDYAATSPASVAFEYRLIHTESGKTLCQGSFSETQESATENLLSLKKLSDRGFKWISASELTREGVAKKLADCNYVK